MATSQPESSGKSAAKGLKRAAAIGRVVARVAVLIRGDARRLCHLRDFAPGALTIRAGCALAVGERVAIEARPGRCLDGRIAWTRGDEAGVELDRAIDLADAFAPLAGRRPKRPRQAVDRLAMIRSGADISFASTRDITHGGIRVVCDRPLPRGTRIVLTLEGFRPLEGVVRWERNGFCAISFNQVIPPGDLTRWLAS